MNNKAQKLRLGIFILVGASLLISLIVFFTAKSFFTERDTYYISYHDISLNGLDVGSPVKYLGLQVGNVTDINIDPHDVSKVIVKVAIKSGTPIKTDSEADVVNMGITGIKAIEIRGGTNNTDFLEKGSYIRAGTSMTAIITGKAEIIALKTEELITNLQMFTEPENMRKFSEAAESASSLIYLTEQTVRRLDTIILDNKDQVNAMISLTLESTQNLNRTSYKLMGAADRINQIIASDTVNQVLGNARDISMKLKEADLGRLITEIANVAEQTSRLLRKVDRDIDEGSKDFTESLHLLKITLDNLNSASRKINNDPSILIRGSQEENIPDTRLEEK